MTMKKIAVIGSVNTDLVFESERFPKKGETLTGLKFEMGIGGKGANQAVAVARLGGDVTFFGSVGKDSFGEEARKKLVSEGICTCFNESEQFSGVAQVNLFENDNSIIVIPGANYDFSPEYLAQIKQEFSRFDIFVFQLEIELSVVEELMRYIKSELKNKLIILNPAPARKLSKEIIEMADILTPNEHEVNEIGMEASDMDTALASYPDKLLVTMGSLGVRYFDSKAQEIKLIPSLKNAEVVDTTGAGDTFSGALTFALASDYPLDQAIEFANTAAGLSIAKIGAQTGMPVLSEVNKVLKLKGKD